MAIALRKSGKARKRNPTGGWAKSPILWIGGGALVALVGYRVWASRSQAPAPITAVQNQAIITAYQATLTALQAANPNPSGAVASQIESLRNSIRAAGGTPS